MYGLLDCAQVHKNLKQKQTNKPPFPITSFGERRQTVKVNMFSKIISSHPLLEYMGS